MNFNWTWLHPLSCRSSEEQKEWSQFSTWNWTVGFSFFFDCYFFSHWSISKRMLIFPNNRMDRRGFKGEKISWNRLVLITWVEMNRTSGAKHLPQTKWCCGFLVHHLVCSFFFFLLSHRQNGWMKHTHKKKHANECHN